MTNQPAARTAVDLLVIGSGTGMAAALAARELGLTALIVEKTAYVGGSTARSGGAFWMPANPILRQKGSPDSLPEARRYLHAVVGDETAFFTFGELPRARLGHRRHAVPHHWNEVHVGQELLRLSPRETRGQCRRAHL